MAKKKATKKMDATTTKKPAPAAKKKAAKPPPEAPKPRVRNRPGGMEGTPWTEEHYAKLGYRRINVRLGPVPAAQLTELERALGAVPTEVVRQAIDRLHRDWKAGK